MLSNELKGKVIHEKVRLAKQRQLVQQKQQLQSLKDSEKAAKKELFSLTRTGRTVALIKKDAAIVGRGSLVALKASNKAADRVARSSAAQNVVNKIRKELGLKKTKLKPKVITKIVTKTVIKKVFVKRKVKRKLKPNTATVGDNVFQIQ